jgi:hypothetical protein
MSIPSEVSPGRWVEVVTTGELAIVIEVGPGDRVLLASGSGSRPRYHNVSASLLTLRPDCDGLPAPAWLAQARFSSHRQLILDRVVDELTYRSYVFNRRRSPDVPVERWYHVFSNADAFEARYQRECAEEEAS